MKVYALQKRTLLGRSKNWWTDYRILQVYESILDALSDRDYLRQQAVEANDDSVDYCVTELNVLTSSIWNK